MAARDGSVKYLIPDPRPLSLRQRVEPGVKGLTVDAAEASTEPGISSPTRESSR